MVSAPNKTTNQLRFTNAQTNRMNIGANNEWLTQASSSVPGFSYSPRQAVVSAPNKTTNQLRFTKAQTNKMNIGANNEWLTQPSSSVPGFSYSPRQAVVSAPSKTTPISSGLQMPRRTE